MIINAPRGIAFSHPIPLVDLATNGWHLTPPIAAGDFQISKDYAAFANPATLPAVEPASSGQVKVVLSASEMEADAITVRAIDQTSPKAWQDTGFIVRTYGTGYIEGTIATATSSSQATLSTAEFPATADAFVDSAIEALTGANKGLTRKVLTYSSGRVATFDPFPTNFTIGDRVRLGGVVK